MYVLIFLKNDKDLKCTLLSRDLLHNITVLPSNKKVRNVLFRATALPSVIKI